jgi:hypothetical protein
MSIVAPIGAAACSGAESVSPSSEDEAVRRKHRDAGAPVDAGSPDSGDASAPDVAVTYPAFQPPVPQVVSYGGPVMHAPKIVVVTFAGDPQADDIERFVASLGPSSYWSLTTSEYGVGSLRALTPIRLSESAPPAIEDADFRTWLSQKLDGTDPDFGSPDPDTIYAVFYPAGTNVTIGSVLTGCVNSGGYHWDMDANGTRVPYAVMPRCTSLGNLRGFDVLTSVASHEIIEAATDPFSQSNPAFRRVNDDDYVWQWFYLTEVGDLCVQDRYLDVTPSDIGFLVQRTWSNVAIRGYHNPCVPFSGVYFNAAPVFADDIAVTDGRSFTTKGVRVPVGESRTIEIDLFSDAPSAPWTVSAFDIAALRGAPAELTLSLDRTSGQNGDKLQLTITALSSNPRGFSAFLLQSSSGGVNTFWPGLVGN